VAPESDGHSSRPARPGERQCGDPDNFSDDSSDDELPPLWKILGLCPPHAPGLTDDSSDEVSNLPWPDRHWLRWLTRTHSGLQASSPPLLTPSPPVYRPLPTYGSLGTQEESNGPNTPASPTRRLPFEERQYPWSIRDGELHPVRPATGDQARHSDSDVSDGRDGSLASQRRAPMREINTPELDRTRVREQDEISRCARGGIG
jgi:hypothetical protein